MKELTIENAYAQMEKDAKRFADSLDGVSDFTRKISESAYLAGETFIATKILDAKSEEPSTKEIDWEQRRYEIAKDLYCRHLEVYADSAVKSADQLIEELKKTSK